MIVLDSNVISEVMKKDRDRHVVSWLRRQPGHAIFTTAVNVAEVMTGIALLPIGHRQDELASAAAEVFDRVLLNRILPFDRAAADSYARIVSSRRRIGRPIKELDAQIAAITKVHSMALATRDAADFVECGIEVIDPWTV